MTMPLTAEITVKVSQIPEFAALIAAALEVRDELRIRGDYGVSADIARRLADALADLGA